MRQPKFGYVSDNALFRNIGDKISKWWYVGLATIGTILIGLFSGSIQSSTPIASFLENKCFTTFFTELIFCPLCLTIFGIILVVIGAWGTNYDLMFYDKENKKNLLKQNEINGLKQELISLQEESRQLKVDRAMLHENIVLTWLKSAYKNLELNTKERITIYNHVGESFYVMGRYSRNPVLEKVHRTKIPDNEGVISTVWEHGYCHIGSCPSFTEDHEEYYRYAEEYHGYSREVLESLNMKSSSFIGLAITDLDSHIGIVLLESQSSDYFREKEEHIKKYIETSQSYLCKYIIDSVKYNKDITIETFSSEEPEDSFLSDLTSEEENDG